MEKTCLRGGELLASWAEFGWCDGRKRAGDEALWRGGHYRGAHMEMAGGRWTMAAMELGVASGRERAVQAAKGGREQRRGGQGRRWVTRRMVRGVPVDAGGGGDASWR